MNKNRVIYCTHCQMWFDTKNGWKANRAPAPFGIPICPACNAPLLELESKEFYKTNKDMGEERYNEVMTWEWPNGEFWKKDGVKDE